MATSNLSRKRWKSRKEEGPLEKSPHNSQKQGRRYAVISIKPFVPDETYNETEAFSPSMLNADHFDRGVSQVNS
jgi:hypothetical protein